MPRLTTTSLLTGEQIRVTAHPQWLVRVQFGTSSISGGRCGEQTFRVPARAECDTAAAAVMWLKGWHLVDKVITVYRLVREA